MSYLVNTISLDSELPSEALGRVHLGTVLGQLALVVVTYCRLKTHGGDVKNRRHRSSSWAELAVLARRGGGCFLTLSMRSS